MRGSIAGMALLLSAATFAGCASTASPPFAPAAAAPDILVGDFGRKGLYLGAYALQSFEQFDTPSGIETDDSDPGAGLRLGWRLLDSLAIEGFAESVDGFSVEQGSVESDM